MEKGLRGQEWKLRTSEEAAAVSGADDGAAASLERR